MPCKIIKSSLKVLSGNRRYDLAITLEQPRMFKAIQHLHWWPYYTIQ